MKLSTLLSVTAFEDSLTFYICDPNADYDIIGEITTTAGNALLNEFGNWYVIFVDFETRSVHIANT